MTIIHYIFKIELAETGYGNLLDPYFRLFNKYNSYFCTSLQNRCSEMDSANFFLFVLLPTYCWGESTI